MNWPRVARQEGELGRVGVVTETRIPDVIREALAVIDRGLGNVQHRELVSTAEVADLLLDLRLLLITAAEPVPAVPAG